MPEFVNFNHQIIHRENALVPAISSSVFYGKGVFTTVGIYNSKPFQWEKHWARLNENAGKIGVDLHKYTSRIVEESLLETLAKNKLIDARARITFFDETLNRIWQTESQRQTSFLIIAANFRTIYEELHLTISPFRVNSTSPLANVKSCNYLENILALEDAKAEGFGEALRLNEREEIVSATMANVFWVKNDTIFTPHLETGCLIGTTRSFVLENFPVKETKTDFTELNVADEIFLTSAGIGIAKVESFEGKILKSEITNQLIQKFYAAVL